MNNESLRDSSTITTLYKTFMCTSGAVDNIEHFMFLFPTFSELGSKYNINPTQSLILFNENFNNILMHIESAIYRKFKISK